MKDEEPQEDAPSPVEGPGDREVPTSREDDPALRRYQVAETADGKVLHCVEAPGISVRVEPRTFSESEARKRGPRVILLDGAGAFGPLVDAEHQVYNLDHHSDCVRPFTLATCEQALVMVAKGIELDHGDWTVLANEPDLDTVLAIWVLLNHRRVLRLGDASRDALLPLLRVEGAIDANGIEFARFSGVVGTALSDAQQRLDQLLRSDRQLRVESELAPIERTAQLLRAIDALVFTEGELRTYRPLEEIYGHLSVRDDLVGVACRDGAGVYEVESRLRDVWGQRLGLVVLENAPKRYTLRAAGPIGALRLTELYAVLNWIDRAVDPGENECWGGASEIGGSPRERGSALPADRILNAARWTFARGRRTVSDAIAALVSSVVVSVLAMGVALLAESFSTLPVSKPTQQLAIFGIVLSLTSLVLARRDARHVPAIPMWRPPTAGWWLLLAPVGVAAGVLGGSWAPSWPGIDPEALAWAGGAALLSAIALETTFRGWLQGLLLLEAARSAGGERAVLSWPTVVTAVAYAATTVTAFYLAVGLAPFPWLGTFRADVAVAGGALVLGLVLGLVRERSRSLWPGVAIQALAAAALMAAQPLAEG